MAVGGHAWFYRILGEMPGTLIESRCAENLAKWRARLDVLKHREERLNRAKKELRTKLRKLGSLNAVSLLHETEQRLQSVAEAIARNDRDTDECRYWLDLKNLPEEDSQP